jgi:hypothetical protein
MREGIDLVVVAHRDLLRVNSDTFQMIMGDLFKRAKLFQQPPREHAEALAHTAS